MTTAHPDKTVKAAMLAIGDELLSGRTKDKNIGYLAEMMTEIGIDLTEVRIVPDDEARIIAAVNELRQQYQYLFTSGGIGPLMTTSPQMQFPKPLKCLVFMMKKQCKCLRKIIKNADLSLPNPENAWRGCRKVLFISIIRFQPHPAFKSAMSM